MSVLFRFLVVVAALTAALAVSAQPVEYVRVCSTYGTGYSYIPGTDICLNAFTGETRVETEGGTWRAHIGKLPGEWVASPRAGCRLGRLVHVGTITRSDLTQNAHGQFETAPFALPLGSNEFISKILLRGGFNATSRSNFCLAFKDSGTSQYSILGCHDTTGLRDQEAVWSFTPLRSVPPAAFTSPFAIVGATGSERWPTETAFDGPTDCWVCVQRRLR